MSPPPVRACIFDVDGLLINTEDIYTDIYNQVLRAHGLPDYPWRIKALQQSRGHDGTNRILTWAGLPYSVSHWNALLKPHHHLFTHAQPLPGIPELLHNLSTRSIPPLQLAIASSSSSSRFALKTSALPSITTPIPPARRVFGDDPEMDGKNKKPFPDLFQIALQRINGLLEDENGQSPIRPEECVVFEDSIAGVEAARRAGMRVIWIPHPGLREVCRGHVDAILQGSLPSDLVEMVPIAGVAPGGEATRSSDGLAEMLPSARDFDYSAYGITLQV